MSTVLVIEDESSVRDFVVCALRMQGHTVFEAENGVVGLALAQARHPDLVLCDVQMPEMDGYETLKALRADPGTATIPFVFLTGYADRADIRQGMEMGADDYLTKPFTLPELTAALKARLTKQVAIEKRSEEKLEMLRSNISLALPHELLTPLNGILGYAAMLLEDHQDLGSEEILDCARNIETSARRLQRLIENFMVYSQIELFNAGHPGAASLLPEGAVQVKPLIEQAAQLVAGRAGRAADLVLSVADASVRIRAEYLTKMVDELVDNAFKFSEVGTVVEVTGVLLGDRFRLEVRDSGRGMSADQIRKVGAHMQFDRRLYEQQGFGLGLIIAKRLAELHGGTMEILSEPSVSTRVTLVLPAGGPSSEG